MSGATFSQTSQPAVLQLTNSADVPFSVGAWTQPETPHVSLHLVDIKPTKTDVHARTRALPASKPKK